MSQIIAGLYELDQKIGAGGGGVVYLGRHLRLQKQVVLKADKRTLSAKEETLRREVDMLKGLSHTYIPQVYDFVQENGTVYTVMDFIEGESLDKLLQRGERLSQPQVIGWACQLLEALSYLHSRPPHGILHGDIKPANIMLRPNGDVCLIDFNIALALGEDGAVKVGFSRGYASPEHYGTDYIRENRPAAVRTVSSSGTASGTDTNAGAAGHREIARTETRETSEGDKDTEATEVSGSGADTEATEVSGSGADTEATEVSRDGTDTEATEVSRDGTDTDATKRPGDTADTEATEVAWGSSEAETAGRTGEPGRGQPAVTENGKGDETGTGKAGIGTTGIGKAGTAGTGSSTTGRSKGILLDVRSDIYSLGATLYHLLSGTRPPQRAGEVKPLGTQSCSPAVAAIIQKAMEPDPARRYQTAEEMLQAFWQLHKRDQRTIRHKRRVAVTAALLSAVFLAGGASTFVGLKQLEQRQEALTLAEYSANRLAQGDVAGAVGLALQAIPTGDSILEAPVTAQAQKALTDALGVYNLADGFKALNTIMLPSAPFDLVISPQGTYLAAVYAYEVAVYELATQKQVAVLPAQESALADCVFADETHLVYAGDQGVTAYNLEAQEILWTGGIATTLAVSGDGQRVAAVNRGEEQAAVYRVSDGAVVAERSFEGQSQPVVANDIFADPQNTVFALNGDGRLLAASFSNGALWIYDLTDPEGDLILYEESDYRHFAGGFCGRYFAFTAEKSGEAVFGMVDTVEAVYLGGYSSQDRLSLLADESGIYLANGSLLVKADPAAMTETELAYAKNGQITGFAIGEKYVLAATDDRKFSFYDSGAHDALTVDCAENCDFVRMAGGYAVAGNRNEPSVRLMRLVEQEESQLLSYDARYVHNESRISGDGKTAMLFDYQGFRIYDLDGNVVTEVTLPDAEQMYDQQFRKEPGQSFLEVTWYDGTIRRYSATDGTLLAEEKGEEPAKDLYEEFFTKQYRIASSLHTAPEVYEIESGRLAATLEEDSYLTYVTQVGEYIITEYISAAGERYGILLDSDLQKLAVLPGLCDVAGDRLVFDYESGDLRQCKLYSLEELLEIGEAYLRDEE